MSYLHRLRWRFKLIIIILICFYIYLYFTQEWKSDIVFSASHKENITVTAIAKHEEIVKEFYEKRMNWTTSKLGAILFKNEPIPNIFGGKHLNRTSYLILIYKSWSFLHNRKVYFGTETQILENCSVKNCIFTKSENMLKSADAIIVHIRKSSIPQADMTAKNPDQRLIFFDDESPPKLLLDQKGHLISQMYNVFNWSMSYRSDADIPVPYGRTIPLAYPKLLQNYSSITQLIPFWNEKKRDVPITTVLTDCHISYKFRILDSLKRHIPIQINNKCTGEPPKFGKCEDNVNCNKVSKYLFHLVLENTKCKEYMTEKLFFLAYSKGAIPIIQGPSVEDCKRLLPPNSYIHMDDYYSIKSLAKEIMMIKDDENKLLSYHAWRNHFEIVNEHGYYGTQSKHLCRICEAMNYNDKKQYIYRDLDILNFLNPKLVCTK